MEILLTLQGEYAGAKFDRAGVAGQYVRSYSCLSATERALMWPYACGSAVHVLQKWFPVVTELLPAKCRQHDTIKGTLPIANESGKNQFECQGSS